MEDCENILYQRQVNLAKTRTKLGKPPTRLQKQAPSSLQLNHVVGGGGGNPFVAASYGNANAAGGSSSSSSSLPVIPLLSPLVVLPKQALPAAEAEEFKFPKCGNDEMSCGGDKGGATAGYTDPSNFFTFFHSKCVLVNDA
ncbi:hypothetical protein Dsin_020382 [Dipteronia sinensis]|uniref:Uncharacterized protein n=1 Tax=Dipteronia sinensis TaxID=43782 RepID=A0AAE0E3Y5_9ROSI|nr:hypothetical protein Dsin_020382 [Dipteronia sinensis]